MQDATSKPTIERKKNKAIVYDEKGRKFSVVNDDGKSVVLIFKNVNIIMTRELANAVCEALKI